MPPPIALELVAMFSVSDSPRKLETRNFRPAIMDLRFHADAWIESYGDDQARLQLGDYPLTLLSALPLDVPSLNQQFCHVRRKRAK